MADTLTVYQYDAEGNHRLVGWYDLNDTDKSPSGSWNIPGNCTTVEPPERKDDYDIIWNGESWDYLSVADVTVYSNNGEDSRTEKYDYVAKEGEAILPADASEDELLAAFPEYTTKLVRKRASKITELKAARDTAEVSIISYDGYNYDFDDKSRDRLDIAYKALALQADGATIAWTMADNVTADITKETIIAVFAAAAVRSNALHVKYRKLKEMVNAAETIEDVEAITFDTEVE